MLQALEHWANVEEDKYGEKNIKLAKSRTFSEVKGWKIITKKHICCDLDLYG